MYLKREIENKLKETIAHYPVILVTGPRQVGKTTLLKGVSKTTHQYITMDDLMQRKLLEEDSNLFFKNNNGPLLLDEVQYVPSAFQSLKLIVDDTQKPGYFLLTGAQSFSLMEHVSESLAGRIAIFQLQGLSLRESFQIEFNKCFIPNDEYFIEREKSLKTYDDIWSYIHRGYMPKLAINKDMDWNIYYQSYVQTYIERDVRQITQVGDQKAFMDFMISMASRSGELLNYNAISKDVGVSLDTIKRWTSILETSGIIYLLYPYSNNHLKRAIKTPKVYFMDTGLLAYLTRWLTKETLQVGAAAGNIFETFVISEIIKSFYNAGISKPTLYFYRDRDQKEIDLIIEDGNDLYPVEIKMTAKPDVKLAKNFSVLKDLSNVNVKPGVILCQYDKKIWLKEDLISIPISYL